MMDAEKMLDFEQRLGFVQVRREPLTPTYLAHCQNALLTANYPSLPTRVHPGSAR